MAGHSKWKNIQNRKGAQDAKRGKAFTKIAVEIMVATRLGGPNPEDNPRLRAALTKAKVANMSKDNWMKAIKKGSGELVGENYVEKNYEGYGPGGVAVYVECLTNNVNRTVGDVRHAFTKSAGSLGTEGSVGWMFDRKGVIVYSKDSIQDFEKLFETAIEQGADDVKEDGDQYEIMCSPDQFLSLKTALDSFGVDPSFCELSMIPKNQVELDSEKVVQMEKLISILEDNDDVQNIHHNGVW